MQGCPHVDLVIRTSGETRLSDFLLQQSSAASLHFTSALWPDFSFTDLLAALCQFQREAPLVAALASAAADNAATHAATAGGGAERPVSSATGAASLPATLSSASVAGASSGEPGSQQAAQHRTCRSPTRGDVPIMGLSPSPGTVSSQHAAQASYTSTRDTSHSHELSDCRRIPSLLSQNGQPVHFGKRSSSCTTCASDFKLQSMAPIQCQHLRQHAR